jgi:hypothetical protein
MKKLFLVSVFLLISLSMQSQILIALLLGNTLNTGKIEFGLDGGWNFANVSNMDSNSWYRKWNLGFYFDIKIKNQWYLNTGVLVKAENGLDNLTEIDLENLGAYIYTNPEDNSEVKGAYSQSISYFVVPALAKYKFDNHMYVEIGPQFALMHDAYIGFESDIDGIEVKAQEDNKDMIQRMDVGASVGTGYRLLKGLGWTLGVRYYYGFVDVYKDMPGQKNSALYMKVMVPIGLSDDKKAQAQAIKDERSEIKANKKKAKKEAKAAEKEAKSKATKG